MPGLIPPKSLKRIRSCIFDEMESLCLIDVMECFCPGPQRPVCFQIKDSSVCFQHAAFRNELDVWCGTAEC